MRQVHVTGNRLRNNIHCDSKTSHLWLAIILT